MKSMAWKLALLLTLMLLSLLGLKLTKSQDFLFAFIFCLLMLGYFAFDCAKTSARKLGLSLVLLLLSLLGIMFGKFSIFFMPLIAGLSLSVLYAMNVGGELRRADKKNRAKAVLGILFETPLLILGLLSILLGCGFIWMNCNSLFKEPRNYQSIFSCLGFGLLLIYMGARWIRGIVTKRFPSVNEHLSEDEPLTMEDTQKKI
jgi:hypothetical protein